MQTPRRTIGVYNLVEDVLRTFSEPYEENIILDVCLAIENNSDWLRRYHELEGELGHQVVNQWIGIYTKGLTGLNSVREVDTTQSKLIVSYTILEP